MHNFLVNKNLSLSLPLPQIEAIFELGDVDGDGEIDMGEFVGKGKGLQRRCIESKV